MTAKHLKHVMVLAAFALALALESDPSTWHAEGPFSSAEARVGRPMTPVSVAGVARRTTRRVVRRTAVYVAALPPGCSTVIINGASLYSCGSVYYQAQGAQYVVVEVQ